MSVLLVYYSSRMRVRLFPCDYQRIGYGRYSQNTCFYNKINSLWFVSDIENIQIPIAQEEPETTSVIICHITSTYIICLRCINKRFCYFQINAIYISAFHYSIVVNHCGFTFSMYFSISPLSSMHSPLLQPPLLQQHIDIMNMP